MATLSALLYQIDDGTVLLPFYIARSAEAPFAVTVVRCTFDGDALTYREHGDVLRLDVVRGLVDALPNRH